ncbi:MAG: methyltransferase domain-containing protein [Lautropia sp.]|nr:methyltransferase domain-containing protein [Lautropia sp.]
MLKPVGLDRSQLRRLFNQKRQPEARADFLLQEAERRLLERLEPMNLPEAPVVLDLGCGLGRSLPLLGARFPLAQVLALDLADEPLRERRWLETRARRGVRGLLNRLRAGARPRLPQWLAADAHRLPLPADSVDVIWSNLVFHWFDDPLQVLRECRRVLRPNGLLIFSAFGVDTGRELRRVCPGQDNVAGLPAAAADVAAAGASPRWPNLQDMHDWGDAMMACGFDAPVMDRELLQLAYRSQASLAGDLAALCFPAAREPEVLPALSIELVFGHAWMPARKFPGEGLVPIRVMRRG